MKLDLTVIKNETVYKFEKATLKVNNHFRDMLAIALDAAIHEIDVDKRAEVEQVIGDMLQDEFVQYRTKFIQCMNKVAEVIENGLGTE